MSFPPAFLNELKTRASLADVAGKSLMWDRAKTNPGKGDYWACCPFHGEQTASFHIDDRRGYYYCFGCHEKGDVISFVQLRENLGFAEAVATLAAEVGLTLPERDPAEAKRAEKRDELAEAMAAAVRFFRLSLGTAEAMAAREYLARRGLDKAALDRFEIGYAPADYNALETALTQAGHRPEALVEAGLLAKRDRGGGGHYPRFRERILFPIRDPRGRCIAFGGRSLDPQAKAKYLNSPETPLFSKSRTLYNHGPARKAAADQPLIAVEGYMDVIALVQAGFEAAVAPLGTAVTADHLRMLWRMADEPILALDGDEAGRRAALRTADEALPLLEPGRSLRFCFLPDGIDPDDLLRNQGAEALRALLTGAEPLSMLLWRRETEGQAFDSPERKAALEKRLRALSDSIAHPDVRRHYHEQFRQSAFTLFRPPRRPQAPQARRDSSRLSSGFGPFGLSAETRRTAPAAGRADGAARLTAQALAAALEHPSVAEAHADSLADLEIGPRTLDLIRESLLLTLADLSDRGTPIDRESLTPRIAARCGPAALSDLARAADGAERTPEAFEAALSRLQALAALRREQEDARNALLAETETPDGDAETLFKRYTAAKEAYETAVSEANRAENSEEPSAEDRLTRYVQQKVWIKKR